MEESTVNFKQLKATSQRFARRLLTIGENRLELLLVEVQQERERLLQAFLLALGVAAFGLLAGATFTGLVVVLFWESARVAVLVLLTLLYTAAAGTFYWRFSGLLRDWHTLAATLDQLRKDRACLENGFK